jgi:putative membrane protein
LFALLALACPIIALRLLSRPFDIATAKRLQHIDRINGLAATLVLIIGMARQFYFGKGVDYHLHSVPFIAKLALYVIASGLSLTPMLEMRRWTAAIKVGMLPTVTKEKLCRLRHFIGWQAACVLGMMACATLAARGVGRFS